MRTNRVVNIKRQAARSGLEAGRSLQMYKPAVRAWIHISAGVLETNLGEQLDTNGTIKMPGNVLRSGDVIEVIPEVNNKYRVEGVEQILSPAGRVVAMRGVLIRDSSLEG